MNFRFSERDEALLEKLRKRWGFKTSTDTLKVAVLICLDRGDDIDPTPFQEELRALK